MIPTCILQPRPAVVVLLLLHLAVPRGGHLLLVFGQEHLRHGGAAVSWSNFVVQSCGLMGLYGLLRGLCGLLGGYVVFEVVLPCRSSKVVRLSGVGLQVGGRAATEEKRRGDEDGRQRRTGPRLPDGKILSLKGRNANLQRIEVEP